jgi:hypothetical protein
MISTVDGGYEACSTTRKAYKGNFAALEAADWILGLCAVSGESAYLRRNMLC